MAPRNDRERLQLMAQLATAGWAAGLFTIVVVAWMFGRLDVGGLVVILPTLAGILLGGIGLARLVK